MYDQIWVDGVVDRLGFAGHRLLNNGRGGFSFDFEGARGGIINRHDDMNMNGYRLIRKRGGGFEIDDAGRVRVVAGKAIISSAVAGGINLEPCCVCNFDRL